MIRATADGRDTNFSILHKEYKTSLLSWQGNFLLCSLMDFGVSSVLLKVFALKTDRMNEKLPVLTGFSS